jgi:hypothetical protein
MQIQQKVKKQPVLLPGVAGMPYPSNRMHDNHQKYIGKS